MDNILDENYNKKISERILRILDYSSLEIKGIAALTKKSIDIYYAIIAKRKKLTVNLAKTIGDSLDFDGMIIFDLNSPIPKSIKESPNLNKFRLDNINNIEYFKDKWTDNKDSTFIKKELIEKGFFNTYRYTWEINNELKKLGRNIKSDNLSKYLKYFLETEILDYKKKPIKLKNGKLGERIVFVYILKQLPNDYSENK